MASVGDDRDPTPGGDDMSALPVEEEPIEAAPSSRVWPVPPPEGWTADDLDRIPDLPPHTELIDGSLVFVSPQLEFHELLMSVLQVGLRTNCPSDLRVRREMGITITEKNRPEPDVAVIDAEAVGEEKSSYPPDAVRLAVEVVSKESQERDRKRKPLLYAEAGIPHFWRVEKVNGEPVVYVYELDPATEQYALTGIHRERLKLTVPFDIDIDLTEVHRI